MDRYAPGTRTAVVPALLMALALLAAACNGEGTSPDGDQSSEAPTSGAATSAVTSTGVPPTTTPPPSPTPSPALEDGKHFGFIRSVDDAAQPPELVLDLAYFLTGDDASQAAQEHGDEYPPPNDYYIVNDNPRLRTLLLSPDVRIRLVDWANCCQTFITGQLGPFADGFENPDPSGAYRGPTSPYWLWVRDGQVVRIQEQYLP